MAYAPNIITGNGSQTDFPVTFPFLRQAHVKATKAGVVAAHTWVNAALIRVSPAPGVGVQVAVLRDTPSVLVATLQDNKPVPASVYNELVKQAIYFAEEQAYSIATASTENSNAAAAAADADRIAAQQAAADADADRVAGAASLASTVAAGLLVVADKNTVAADKAIVAADKATSLQAAIDAANSAYQASLFIGAASSLNGQAGAYYLARGNHTGTQAQSTIVNLTTDLGNKQPLAAVLTNTTASFLSADRTKLDGIAPNANAYALPARLNVTASQITDWNTATSNGWYMASGATNSPGTGWWIGSTENHGAAGFCTQTLHPFASDGAAAPQVYRRSQDGGAWGAWYLLIGSMAGRNLTVSTSAPSGGVDGDVWFQV